MCDRDKERKDSTVGKFKRCRATLTHERSPAATQFQLELIFFWLSIIREENIYFIEII